MRNSELAQSEDVQEDVMMRLDPGTDWRSFAHESQLRCGLVNADPSSIHNAIIRKQILKLSTSESCEMPCVVDSTVCVCVPPTHESDVIRIRYVLFHVESSSPGIVLSRVLNLERLSCQWGLTSVME